MSNILNLKGVKFFAIVLVAVAVLATFGMVAVQSASADCMITTTLRVGSTGTEVQCLQGKVGATADGKFGPMTAMAVKAYQTSHGLVADGVVGPKSIAVLNAGGVVSGSFPAGCTSAAGFSMTTGQPCNAVVAGLPAGCSSTAGFSPLTGTPCSGGSSLPAGCTSTAGYSVTNGAKCDSGATAPISASGEGSVTLTYAPVPANSTSVDKGESKNVMALEVKATGSDMKVNRIWLDINTRIWLSASEVSLMDGSTVVATLPLSASTVEEVTAGSAYRLQFNGLNINVPVNTTKTLTFKVTRPELTNANASVTVAATSTLRAIDMAGFSETYTLGARTWTFSSNTAATGTLTSTLNTSNISAAKSVSGLSTTAGQLTAVKLMDFNLKAEDGAVNITAIAGTLAASSGTLANQVASVELRDASGNVLSSKTGATTYTFNELNIDIAEDATKTFSVWAQMNPIGTPGAGFTSKGAGITAAIGIVTATSGATFASASTSNTVTGYAQHMFEYAPSIAFGSATAVNTGVDNKDGSYTLAFTVSAPAGKDIYVDAAGATLTAVAKTAAMGGTLASNITASGATSKGAVATAFDKVVGGTSRTFTVTGYVPAGGTAGFTGIKVVNVTWTDTDHASSPTPVTQTWGVDDIKTAEVYVKAS